MKFFKRVIFTTISIILFYFLFHYFTGVSFFDFYEEYVRNTQFGKYYLDVVLLVVIGVYLFYLDKEKNKN